MIIKWTPGQCGTVACVYVCASVWTKACATRSTPKRLVIATLCWRPLFCIAEAVAGRANYLFTTADLPCNTCIQQQTRSSCVQGLLVHLSSSGDFRWLATPSGKVCCILRTKIEQPWSIAQTQGSLNGACSTRMAPPPPKALDRSLMETSSGMHTQPWCCHYHYQLANVTQAGCSDQRHHG